MLSARERAVISRLQKDLPASLTPYADLARELEMEEDEILSIIEEFQRKGMLRRLGAALYHRNVGYTANAMVVWQVPSDRVEDVGMTMATFPEASHVYQRPVYPGWPYNLFTMIHGNSKEECEAVAARISAKTGIKNYLLLYSLREFKKTSINYF